MPSHYTHLVFGRLVLEALPTALRKTALQAEDAYYAGLHGPDILFYYHPLRANPVSKKGFDIHFRSGLDFFAPAKQILRENPSPARRSYLMGFLCHYMLDSACHPYINQKIQESGVTHAEIETECDALLLREEGHDPLRWDTIRHLKPSPDLAAAIAPFYAPVTPRQIEGAMESMKRCVRLLRATGLKRAAAFRLMKLAGVYEEYHGMFLSPAPNPLCNDSSDTIKDQMLDTVEPTAVQIRRFLQAVGEDLPLSDRLEPNFS